MILLFILCKLLSNVRIKPPQRRRTVTQRTVIKTTSPARNGPQTARTVQRDAERIRKEQFKRIQAEQDIIHYRQVKADLLKAYDAAGIEGDTEKAIRRRITYDNSLRRVEKQIEKSAYDARTGL